MPAVDEFVAAVDAFIAARKQIVGVTTPQRWSEGRAIGEGELALKFPIEVNGEQHPSRMFIVSAYPDSEELKFVINLTYQWSVFRLDYEIDRLHSNVNRPLGSKIPISVMGPHYHPWNENKAMIKHLNEPPKLPMALPLDIHIRQFDQALRWFCRETNIDLRDHAIDLPPRQRLI